MSRPIDNDLAAIKNAVYGEQVRDSIVSAIQKCYDDSTASAQIADIEAKGAEVLDSIPDPYEIVQNNINISESLLNTGEYVFSSSDFEQGYWSFSFPGTDQNLISKRIRNRTFLFVKKGMKIYYSSPTLKIYLGVLPTPTTGMDPGYLQTTSWINTLALGCFDIKYDGYLVMIFEGSNNITPENYDALVRIGTEHNVGSIDYAAEIYASLANDGEYTIKPSDLESGLWSWSIKSNNTARARSKSLIPVRAGMVFSYSSQAYDVYFGVLPTKTAGASEGYIQGGTWCTDGNGRVVITADGYLPVIIRSHSSPSSNIDPAEFNGVIKISTSLNGLKDKTIIQGTKIDGLTGELSRTIANVNGSLNKDETLYNLFNSVEDKNLDDLLDETGDFLEFPYLYLKELEPVKQEVESLRFIPENYVYNSGTGGYYQYTATPILYIDGDVSKMTKETKAKNLSARFKNIRCGCSCKWQGASSIAYPKKSYTVTFDAPVLIMDKWGSKSKYVLKSEFSDNTHTRNTVSARLWAEIVRDRETTNGATILEEENGNPITTELGNQTIEIINSRIMGSPGCGSTDGFHIMLVINGEYMGLYTMGIPKDDWMFGMDNGSPNCCVLNAEKNCEQTKFNATTTAEDIDDENTFSVEYASDDMTLSRITTSINNAITAIKNAPKNDSYRSAIETYFDVDSAIDYMIYSLLIGNWDGISHNFNLATYDGVKWMFCAYDLDNTFGMEDLIGWNFNTLYDSPLTVRPNLPFSENDSKLLYLVQQFDRETFKSRYNHLRNTVLSESNVFTKFYNFICCVSKRVLAEELVIWPTTPRSGAQTVDAIINFYRLRCQHIDSLVSAI